MSPVESFEESGGRRSLPAQNLTLALVLELVC